jgi:3-oxoadipate CoA-transferase alpha subunit
MGVNTVDVETPNHRKLARTPQEAVAGIKDGDLLLVGGWGGIGVPHELIFAASKLPVRNLTLVSNNCGTGIAGDVGELFKAGLITKVITTFPVHTEAVDYLDRVKKGEVEVELTPQGTLAERLRCAGAGLGGFFTPTGVGTELGENKESRIINGKEFILEQPLHGDFAIIKADLADEMGNLRFRFAARSFNPLMAMAARKTIVEVRELVPVGAIKPDDIHLPGIFVDTIYVSGTGS